MAILRFYNLVSLISTEWRIAWPAHLFTCHCFHIYYLLLGVYRPGCGTVPRVKSRSWSPPEVVGRIYLVDVHGGHSSCGSVTNAPSPPRALLSVVAGVGVAFYDSLVALAAAQHGPDLAGHPRRPGKRHPK